MSPIVPVTAGSVAALLLYGRIKRLSSRPQRSYWGNPRSLALAEALASALTVLFVGHALDAAMAPAPAVAQPVFAMLAIAIGISQFVKSLRAPRALITTRG